MRNDSPIHMQVSYLIRQWFFADRAGPVPTSYLFIFLKSISELDFLSLGIGSEAFKAKNHTLNAKPDDYPIHHVPTISHSG